MNIIEKEKTIQMKISHFDNSVDCEYLGSFFFFLFCVLSFLLPFFYKVENVFLEIHFGISYRILKSGNGNDWRIEEVECEKKLYATKCYDIQDSILF